MATFVHGLNTKVLLGGGDISEFFRSSSVDLSKDTHETTAFGSSAKTFIPGLRDATASLEGMLSEGSSEVLEAMLEDATGQAYCVFPEGCALGKAGFGLIALETAHAITSSTDDVNQVSAEFQGNGGADRVISLHDLVSEAVTGNGGTQDDGAATTEGGVGYVHVAGVGTTADVKIQHSTNGSIWTDLITFSQASGSTSEKVAVAGTINRYVRAIWTLAGGAATFQVSLGRGLPTIP